MTPTDAILLVPVVVIAILVAIWAVIRRMDTRDTQFGRIEGQLVQVQEQFARSEGRFAEAPRQMQESTTAVRRLAGAVVELVRKFGSPPSAPAE
jgi:hypothetical protein